MVKTTINQDIKSDFKNSFQIWRLINLMSRPLILYQNTSCLRWKKETFRDFVQQEGIEIKPSIHRNKKRTVRKATWHTRWSLCVSGNGNRPNEKSTAEQSTLVPPRHASTKWEAFSDANQLLLGPPRGPRLMGSP